MLKYHDCLDKKLNTNTHAKKYVINKTWHIILLVKQCESELLSPDKKKKKSRRKRSLRSYTQILEIRHKGADKLSTICEIMVL